MISSEDAEDEKETEEELTWCDWCHGWRSALWDRVVHDNKDHNAKKCCGGVTICGIFIRIFPAVGYGCAGYLSYGLFRLATNQNLYLRKEDSDELR